MKPLLFLLSILAGTSFGICQSKLVPVSQSAMTGVALPEGTKQDKRLFPVAAASTLMSTTAEEQNLVATDQVEVFMLPPNQEATLKASISQAGWQIAPVQGEPLYFVLSQSERRVLIYLSSSKNSTDFYLCELQSQPQAPSNSEVISTPPAPPSNPTQSSVQPMPSSPTTPVPPPPVAGDNTFTFTRTNFDDGWVANVFPDWVRVVKDPFEVYLYYSDDYTIHRDQMEPQDYYWTQLISQRYTISSSFRWSEITYPPIYFMEGDARDKATGRTCYLGMNVLMNNGIANVILIVAPNKATFKQHYPHPTDTKVLMNYNKFAVGASDIVGTWSGSDGASVSLYNVYTGAYAGSNFASSADSFTFNADGTYESKHSGASSTYGNTTGYSQTYKGKATVTNWEMTLTNRWKGATDKYNIQFEAVRGGRILHLQQSDAIGIQYHLIRVNK